MKTLRKLFLILVGCAAGVYLFAYIFNHANPWLAIASLIITIIVILTKLSKTPIK